jgi:acyl-CoA thioesterase I
MKTRHFFFTLVAVLSLNAFSLTAHAADPMAPIRPEDFKAPIKLACIGDSITEASDIPEPARYPTRLQSLLGSSWKVSNFGLSGHTLLKKGDYPYWNTPRHQEALKSAPDVVIIMLGTNDTKPQNWQFKREFFRDYTELVKSFQALESKPRIYVCRPCPVPEPGNFGINEKNTVEAIKIIDRLAKAMNLGVIDMHQALESRPELLPDNVHPNAEGYEELAKTAYKVLTGKPALANPVH